ncbi:hypothetical protein SPAN111604_13450 [Sphingomonas antarctica]|uniref:flagellar biosynthesis anti-sigma factor FlgM n=1 Tax=Sphingomonas antarctica TaxID=2040274 RepID=UPI0039E77014
MIERIEGSPAVRRASAAPVKGVATIPTGSKAVGHSEVLATARSLADQPMPVDHYRVAQLRQAIGNGSYRIDAQSIARAMQDYPMQDQAHG